MRTARFTVLILIALILFVSQAFAVRFNDPRYLVQGSVDHAVEGDSVYYLFDIQTTGFQVDSIWLAIEGNPRLFSRTESGVVIPSGAAIDSTTNRYRVTGVTSQAHDGSVPKWVTVRATGMIGEDTVRVGKWKRLRPYTTRILFNLLGYGYGEGEPSAGDTRHSGLFACEFGASFVLDKGDISAAFSYSGGGGSAYRYTFAEPIAVRYKFLPFGRTGMVPSLSAGFKRSVYTVRRQQNEFDDSDWNFEGGIALEGAFERIGYSYSSGLGGYHTFSVLMAAASSEYVRLGTRFEYVKLERGDVFRLLLHFEGMGWGDGETETLDRIYDRPLYHKVLSRAFFAPFLPIYGIAKLIGKS